MNAAVCTSGGYERPAALESEHHLLDPRTGHSPRGALGVTVIASTALVADALATAAFVLGPARGLRLLEEQGLAGLIVASDGRRETTRIFRQQFERCISNDR
jgi:thiamine biosynthesis lipoprotein